jgi:uncharacterized protein (TIGR00645 family)
MIKKYIEKTIFGSKWLLIPFYLGLIIALVVYCTINLMEIGHLLLHFTSMTEEESMLMILKLVDMTMIANLVKMIITGSYNSFVDKHHQDESEKIGSGMLKVKMATSLIGVSSIHLLKTFLEVKEVGWDALLKLGFIHWSFLIGGLILAFIDNLHVKGDGKH